MFANHVLIHANAVKIVQINVIHAYRLLPRRGLSQTQEGVSRHAQLKLTQNNQQGNVNHALATVIDAFLRTCAKPVSQDFTTSQRQLNQNYIHKVSHNAWTCAHLHQFLMTLQILLLARSVQIHATLVKELLKLVLHVRMATHSQVLSVSRLVQTITSLMTTTSVTELVRESYLSSL